MRGVYIHIPFCQQICYYCDFNKVFLKNQPVDEYIEAVGKEFALLEQAGHSFEHVETVFLGGGTPTALSVPQLERLFQIIHQYIDVAALAEFSSEANPDDLSDEQLKVLQEYGVSRLSIGVQTFDEQLLRRIGRTHTNEDVERVIEHARRIGFENISIDLMYGLPEQTMDQWTATLDRALGLGLQHFSAYSLIVEPKTVFYNLMSKGKLPLPGEDLEAEMFAEVMERMKAAGYAQYEISNFAKPGYESAHNLLYWENAHYAGIGAGAHGYLGTERYANVAPLKQYIQMTGEGRLPVLTSHTVTKEEQMEEELFLGLRKTEGVSIAEFQLKFDRSIQSIYGEQIEKLQRDKLLKQENGRIFLTKKGIFQGNNVFQQFLLER